MKILRWLVDALINFFCRLIAPKPAGLRSPQLQAEVDAQTKNLILYHFNSCPYCLKVRWTIKCLGVQIEMRDILQDEDYERELVEGGGFSQVPCLRIANGDGVQWLYESSDIVAYLRQRFPVG